jgi:DNA-binding NarL/FixJ family response regulator
MRVLLADDHPVVRSGLRSVLASQADMEIVGEEPDGARALMAIRALKPDVAVLDIQMPQLSGIDVARQLAAESSPTAVVVLSLHQEESDVRSALDAGVCGYVVKEDAAAEVVQAIRAAARREMDISPRISGTLVHALRQKEPGTTLTPRERDVLRLLAEGLRSKEIAARLKLSPKTVEGHRASVMDKLDIHSVAGLVKYALKHRLTEP